jgi:hypothetical protein
VKFDRFDDGAVATATEVLPDGDHVCEITAEKEWSAQDGSREAVIVTFTPVSGAPAFDKRSGLQTLWVNGFKSAPQAPAPKLAREIATEENARRIAKKTASQKATASMDDPDDVPF